MSSIDTSTPVIILGGQENALAVTRSLGALGIDVYVSGGGQCWAHHSHYCKHAFPIPDGTRPIDYWQHLLINPGDPRLEGAIIFAGNDDGLEFIAKNLDALERRYVIEDFDPEMRLDLLDKRKTIEMAEAAGVPAPRQWPVRTLEDVRAIEPQLRYPAMIKAINTHAFNRAVGAKVLIADSFAQLCAHAERSFEHDLEIMVVEMIPGGDDQLCSYFTYITPEREYLFDYTKSVVRRFPNFYGSGVCHVTRWQPDVAAMGRKFLDSIGFVGNANIEFKRDGDQLKIIELNSRFVGSHEVVVASGAPICRIIYCYLTKQPLPTFETYEQDRYLWATTGDLLAALEMRRRGELTLRAWASDLLRHKITLQIFRLTDPMPALQLNLIYLKKAWQRLTRGAAKKPAQTRQPPGTVGHSMGLPRSGKAG